MDLSVRVKVWGDFACFTRPELGVERVSYDYMTPSAARNIVQAIYWHRPLQWRVERIEVLRPIAFTGMTHRELTGTRPDDLWNDPWNRKTTLRHSLVLRDVAYVIQVSPFVEGATDRELVKHREQLRRRLRRGECFSHPYFGVREFAAYFSEDDGQDRPIQVTRPIETMLFDMRYPEDQQPVQPLFFRAKLDHGILHVPQSLYASREH